MMEFKQSVSRASLLRSWAQARWFVPALSMVVVVLAGCGGGTAIEPVMVATPVPIIGDAEQLPDTESSSPAEPTATSSQAATSDSVTAVGPIGTLIETVWPIEDMHGNLITVHGVHPWPDSYAALRSLGGSVPLAGQVDDVFSSATSLAAVDVSVCARTLGDIDVADTAGVFSVGNQIAAPMPANGNGSLSSSDSTLVPGLVWPDVGACARGWLAVATTADLSKQLFVHYWAAGDDLGEDILVWSPPVVTAPPASTADSFGPGQIVTFNGGELTGASIVVDGWAELVKAPAGSPGTRPVGLSLQACPSQNGVWPNVGLSVDGWNLAQATTRTIGALDALTQSAAACDNGWLIFEVPNGGRVTGAFVAEQPGTPGARWSLVGAALPDPS